MDPKIVLSGLVMNSTEIQKPEKLVKRSEKAKLQKRIEIGLCRSFVAILVMMTMQLKITEAMLMVSWGMPRASTK